MADVLSNEQTSEQADQASERTMEIAETSTARLMITKIVNENFKSYAGTQELGPFHKVCIRTLHIQVCAFNKLKLAFLYLCLQVSPKLMKVNWNSFLQNFSSIVGPNGSGKSNVIDAMLFVFGYRSKMIRTKKVSQLIHNSENHQNVQSCRVAVHFQKIIDLVSRVVNMHVQT